MKVKDQKTVRIDPNRKHTLAEVRLVMDVYGCDETRARAILKIRLSPQRREEIRGMVDAILVEQAIDEGRTLRTPAWMLKPNMV